MSTASAMARSAAARALARCEGDARKAKRLLRSAAAADPRLMAAIVEPHLEAIISRLVAAAAEAAATSDAASPTADLLSADELDRVMRRTVIDLVDHHDLDEDVPALRGVVSSGENLAVTFYRLLEPALPPGRLHRVAVVETENNRFEHGPGTGHGDRV